jgi:hypothetical protein
MTDLRRLGRTEDQTKRPPTDAGCVLSKTFVFSPFKLGAPRGSESRALLDLPGPMDYGEPYSLCKPTLGSYLPRFTTVHDRVRPGQSALIDQN